MPSISDAIGVELPSDLSDPHDENPPPARPHRRGETTPSDVLIPRREEERPLRDDRKVSTSLRLLSGTNELLKRVAKRSGHQNLHEFALLALSEKIDRLTDIELNALHAGPPKRNRSD